MAAKRRKKTNVKAHSRQTASGVIRVKAHCRRPPMTPFAKAQAKAREWGF